MYGYVHGSLINCKSGFNSPPPNQQEDAMKATMKLTFMCWHSDTDAYAAYDDLQ